MPNPVEAFLIGLIVLVVLTAYRLPSLGDALGDRVRHLFKNSK